MRNPIIDFRDAKGTAATLAHTHFICPNGHEMFSVQHQGKKKMKCVKPGCEKQVRKV